MSTTPISELTKRLRNVQGQLDGIQRMLGAEKDCFSVLPQFKAAKAGLEKCIALYLKEQATACMGTKIPPASREKMAALIGELTRF